jgi:hypothetical protein
MTQHAEEMTEILTEIRASGGGTLVTANIGSKPKTRKTTAPAMKSRKKPRHRTHTKRSGQAAIPTDPYTKVYSFVMSPPPHKHSVFIV